MALCAYGRARLSSSFQAGRQHASTGGRTQPRCCRRSCHPVCTGSGHAHRPARTAPEARGPGSHRRPRPSAASHTRQAEEGCGWAAARAPAPSRGHRDPLPRPANAGTPGPGKGARSRLTCSEQDWGTAASSGSSHSVSGLSIFCMFPNSVALKLIPGHRGLWSVDTTVLPTCGPPRPVHAHAHLPAGIPSRSAAHCSHHTAHRCGSGICCPAPAAGTGPGG